MAAPKKKKKAKKAPKRRVKGRPDIFSQEKADLICEQISTTSKSLRTICKMKGMPSVQTVLKWLREDRRGFVAQYARAKEEQADFMCEEMIDIADDGSNDLMTIEKGDTSYEVENKEVTNRSKLRVETRKWLASKLKPKKYGDKLDMELTGKDGGPIETKFDITLNLNK
jgi:hypothetical protein